MDSPSRSSFTQMMGDSVAFRSAPIAYYRHTAKLAVAIADAIVNIRFKKLYLSQRVTTPGDY